jgi:hypothetical protein
MDTLIFSTSPEVTIASNTFINVPTILQYEDVPLIEVVKIRNTNFTTQIRIYDINGIYLAKVKGSRLFTTDAGKKAGLILRYPKNMTVCELNGKTMFETKYISPVALSTSAELYTPDGAFIKTRTDSPIELFSTVNGSKISVSGSSIQNCTFVNLRIGIQVFKNGTVSIAIA